MALPKSLPHHIRSYLTSPDVDLQTVSAKQIRKQLATLLPGLDIKAYRTEIDEISIPIFHEIKESVEAADRKAAVAAAAAAPVPAPVSMPSSSLPPLALPSRGIPGVVQSTSSQVSQPAQQQQQRQSNSSQADTPKTSQRSAKATPNKAKKRKSAAYVDSEDDEEAPNGSAKKRKGPKKPRAENGGPGSNKGIHKELNCSAALSEFIGLATCSRPQVVKKLWEHIKANDLQNPNDKRQIMCDEALKKIFNTNSVHMFTMNKLLGDHLFKEEEVVQQS